jgi:hypothetical protein
MLHEGTDGGNNGQTISMVIAFYNQWARRQCQPLPSYFILASSIGT